MLHSRYQQRGGEDLCTLEEAALLRDHGHDVELVEYDNYRMNEMGKVSAGLQTIWSFEAVRDVRKRLATDAFDVFHLQNYFPMISPAVILAASRARVPTVQALRNYRLTCVNGIMFREGKDCRLCVGQSIPWQGIRHACFRGSRSQSAVIAAMIATHRALGTWSAHTDAFITTSDAVRNTYIDAGFPEDRLHTKPDIVYEYACSGDRERRALFVGRLTREKGVDDLIRAWSGKFPDAKLTIVGTGPFEAELIDIAKGDQTIEFTGEISREEVMNLMARSRVVVVPSIWAEPFGRIATEAFSAGTPVIATARGGLIDIVGKSGGGENYEPGDLSALSTLIRRALDDNQWWTEAAYNARRAFTTTYSSRAILKRTEEIYYAAIRQRHTRNDARLT